MDSNLAINYRNPIMVRKLGIEALCKELGSVGMAYFIRQYEIGTGDYTKEKYETEDYTMEEIEKLLEEHGETI